VQQLPSKIEKVSDEARIGQIFNDLGVEEDSEVRELLERAVLTGVVSIVDKFDLLDIFLFGLVEVRTGRVYHHSDRAGLGH